MDEALRHWANGEIDRLGGGEGSMQSWQALRVEASHRRFYRAIWRPRQPRPALAFVAMHSPPALENNARFVAVAELFAGHRVGVPRLLARDESRGFFLMTDLGERHFEDVYRHPGPDAALPGALDALHRLQRIVDPEIPPYTRQRFEDELGIYVEWFLGRLLDLAPDPALTDSFAALLTAIAAQPVCCVHRDFHCRNLLLTAEGQVGVVDFQDALMGPASYDLASLLRDCYYRFPEADVAHWRDLYLAGTSLPLDAGDFPRQMDFTALQRQLKAVGIFSRLFLRDGRDTHLPHIVPVLVRIEELAGRYRELRPLAQHIGAVLPAARARPGHA